MPACSKTNCKKPAVEGGLCADHLRLKKQAEQKGVAMKAAQDKKSDEGADKRTAGAALQVKNEATAKLKTAKIKEIAVKWNAQIQAVVTQVKALRSKNPKIKGINAGTNAVGTTLGGTNNPVKFVLPTNDYKITAAEVYAVMTGFDGSDSGSFKFRIGDVFVHGH